MKTSIKTELESHLLDMINDGVLTNDNQEEHHFHAFNEDYYIIGYYESSEWLKLHDIGELEGAQICVDYEEENFGECHKKYDNTEVIVNMLAYIYGEELLNNLEYETTQELKELVE